MTTIAERLGISPGSIVWLIGGDNEGDSLLDSLPEGDELYETEEPEEPRWSDDTWGASFPDGEPEEADEAPRPRGVDVAVLVVGNSQHLVTALDDMLPRSGSIPLVWVCAPTDEVPTSVVAAAVEDYGWSVNRELHVDDAWTAWSIIQ